MLPSCRRASDNLSCPAEQTRLLYKEVPELPPPALAPPAVDPLELLHLGLGGDDPEPAGQGRTWGLLVNPTALIPVTQPGDLRAGPRRAAGQTGTGRRDLGRNPSRLRPRSRDVPGVLRPGRESDALGRAGRELPGLAGRGREVVLHGGGPPGGHQSSDPGGGQGRVDAGRNRRCHQRCERRAPAWQPHRQLAHPGAGAGTAFAAGPGEPQGQTRLCHPGSPARLWAAADGAGLRGEGRRHRPAGEPLGAGRHHGKGNRVRSVAVPAWVKAAIDAWTTAAGITEGKIFRAVRKGGKVWGEDLTPGAVLQIVQQYARAMGLEKLAPHDMRRTCAKLCRKRGGDLEQIKFLLGHASIQTTERYLGAEQDFISAVNDNLGLEK